MHPIDRQRRERIKRKRAENQHVVPAPGREAREARREATKGRGWFTRPPRLNIEPEVVPMEPRLDPLALRQNARRREREMEQNRPASRVRPAGVIWVSWRWVSGIMSIALILVLYGLLSSDLFYVHSVAVGGVDYLTREEVFRFAGVSQKHIFWIDPDEVEKQLEANANIADAEVHVGWPDPPVQIVIRERDPVITWEQGTDRVWVDINGTVMYQREDRADLLRVVYDPNETTAQIPLGLGSRIDMEVVHGALLLKSRLPTIDVLLYHPIKGLGWRDPQGWMAWFGIGDNMAMKALVYQALVARNKDALQFGEIDVSDPDNPVYTFLWRKGEQ